MKKNDEIILNILDYTAEGSGVGRYEGMAVFVPLTAVGDTVRVKILKVKKTYAYGKVLEILEKCNSCGANMLLNIGPDHLGRFPAPSIEILKELNKKK